MSKCKHPFEEWAYTVEEEDRTMHFVKITCGECGMIFRTWMERPPHWEWYYDDQV